ncbi:hypothetical protein KFK09_012056 [Dendrobium nobile]|uniref:Ubiquitin-like domain-containing protein n=1 Tax=Dendrobium nobile TaxID=94219 RepID=A0A8T3BEI8_DENNO|nr:hypothetical protein KFK09_012056 [Dendrobium nobile]
MKTSQRATTHLKACLLCSSSSSSSEIKGRLVRFGHSKETLICYLSYLRRSIIRRPEVLYYRWGRSDSLRYRFLSAVFAVNRRSMRVGDQMSEDDHLELKFRLYDGSDIGPIRFASSSTVAVVKSRIIADWPKDKKLIPKSASDIKLISAGKILENHKTILQCRPSFGELPGGVITMHVVVQPSLGKSKTEKKVEDMPKKSSCSCSIL